MYYCNLEEHAHGAACFDESGAFICRLPEHVHQDACLIRPTAQPTATPTPEPTATPEEIPEATPDEADEEPTPEPTATPEEIPEATPGEAEEAEPDTPDDAPETAYACGKQEHAHTAACCDESGTLVCALEEHRHDESCLAAALTAEEQAQVDAVAALIEAIPAQDALEALAAAYREAGDRAGFLAWFRETAAQVNEALAAYDALADALKAQVTGIDGLQAAKALLDALLASVAPALTDDGAYVSELAATGSEVFMAPDAEIAEEREQEDASTVRNGERIRYEFDVRTASYTDAAYGEGRVRLEFVLPLPAEKAVFDLSDMDWLDQTEGYAPVVTAQTMQLDGAEVSCQVLTGYRLLRGSTLEERVIPGAFTGYVTVSVLAMAQDEQVSVTLSAAMEHSAWDGTCPTHQTEEKRSVQTQTYTVRAQQTAYEAFLLRIEALEALGELDDASLQEAEALFVQLREALERGELTEEEFKELNDRVFWLVYGDPNSLAEPAVGTNWMALRSSGWFSQYSGSTLSTRTAQRSAAVLSANLLVDDDVSAAAQPSDVQVDDRGGTNASTDGSVSVSKTIAGTDLENVFDITLQVQTEINVSEIVHEPDMAVVIVMDISNTMNSNFGDVTRYAAAMTAAENFLDRFAANNSLGISKVGFVAFNTDAHQIFGLQSCSTQEQVNALKNTMRRNTGSIINASDYNTTHNRFTNVEAGLKMGADMLNGTKNKNKFIIFLSDGFPTTYIRSGYSGYDPYDTTGQIFKDRVLNKPCKYGTSYSDEAAIRARKRAAAIKSSGVTIFSIGVDVAGQTIQTYITQSEKASDHSVVDRTGTTYEIGDASSTEAYKSWLRDKIGSGYYYDSTNSDGLSSAFNTIFAEIKQKVEAGSVADWVANDPMPTINNSAETVEFIGFYSKKPELVSGNLTGSYAEDGENTASYVGDKAAISWDLKKSGYETSTSGGTTTYIYRLVYRVRLKNEIGSFGEGTIYPTNDTTILQYRTIQGTDGNLSVSDPKTVDFPIPSVHGYLAELRFTKVDTQGGKVPGAVFLLRHEESLCGICRGNGTSVTVADKTAVSGADGSVSFTKIPSGHTYTLKETKAPDGYLPNDNTYTVTVAYDQITVTVKDAGGNAVAWDDRFVNEFGFELPQTGGTGRMLYAVGGLLLTAAGALLLYHQARRRRGDRPSS